MFISTDLMDLAINYKQFNSIDIVSPIELWVFPLSDTSLD